MNKKNKYLFRITSLILALLCMCTMTFALNEDHTGDVENGGDDKDNGELATNNKWGGISTGTRYTFIDDKGNEKVYDLPAGTSIHGSENIKGHQSAGYDWADKYGSNYDLPENGTLELERDDWAALLEANGETELAEQVRNGEIEFTGNAEQYIHCERQSADGTWPDYYYSAVDMKAMLDAHNRGETTYAYKVTNPDGTETVEIIDITGIAYIDDFIENSYKSFTEGDQGYGDREAYNAALGLDKNKGYAGYHYKVSGDNDGDGKPDTVTPTPTPTPTPTRTVTITITLTPTPTPTPTPNNKTEYTITKVTGSQSTPNPKGSIYDKDNFGVKDGNPIPTSENIYVDACTDLYGIIKGLEFYRVDFKEQEYTYKVKYETYRNKLDENGKTIKNEDGTLQKEFAGYNYFPTRITLPGFSSEPYMIINNAEYDVTYTVGIRIMNDLLTTTDFTLAESIVKEYDLGLSYRDGIVDVESRIEKKEKIYNESQPAASRGEAIEIAKTIEEYYSAKDFWDLGSSDIVLIETKSGKGYITQNGPIVFPNDRTCIKEQDLDQKINEAVANKSDGSNYLSSGIHIMDDGSTYYGFDVNDVRVHTPIYSDLNVTTTAKNQLIDKSKAGGKLIVPVDEKFTVTLNIDGNCHYPTYNNLNLDLQDYVKVAEILCPFCSGKIVNRPTSSTITHSCKVPAGTLDNNTYKIKSKVTAINGTRNSVSGTGNCNIPDAEYVLEDYVEIYVVGKMYDLEVRATDDPGWKDFKDKEAQHLNKMPVGEAGDNLLSAYKYGIKLGYRAYFDLKTLGEASKEVQIIPKLYYVDTNGNIIDNVDFYYRTATGYKKLSDSNDITINMTMLNTKGDKYNPEFNEEIRRFLAMENEEARNANYSKKLNIGGLSNITLDYNNSTLAKYPGFGYIGNSRRWYGEVYVPASTVVAKSNATITDVARGVNTYKTGYILVTFNPIETVLADGKTSYLRYSAVKDEYGTDILPSPYILLDEKAGKGSTNPVVTLSDGTQKSATPIKMPNMLKNINLTEESLRKISYLEGAPIIIYDVSLRANNDYESSGTH